MPTVMDAALAADAVYEPLPRLEGWTLKTFRPSGTTIGDAFQGALFVRGDETLIAFKGTSQKRDFLADAKLAVGMGGSSGTGADFRTRCQPAVRLRRE